jgi:hypothetical protein
MDKTVARLNIEYLRKKLATETDDAKWKIIIRIIADEEAKALALGAPPKQIKNPHQAARFHARQ